MILKSMIEDRDILELCLNYLDGEEFGDLREAFEDVIRERETAQIIGISLNDEIEKIPYVKIKESIKALVSNYLNSEIKKANSRGNMEAVLNLTQRKMMIGALQ